MPIWITDEETLTITANAIESFIGVNERHPEIEMILMDNASLIGGGWIRSHADIYVRYSKNKGFTVAINDGIKLANGNVIAWVNNDIRVAPNWIEVCTKILEDPTIATVHPKMINYDDPFSFGKVVSDDERLCSNSFVVTKHKDYLFDEGFGIGGGADDWDIAWRMRKDGLRRVWTDMTAYQHKNSFSLKKLGNERQKIVDQNNALFISKWGKPKEELFREAGLI